MTEHPDHERATTRLSHRPGPAAWGRAPGGARIGAGSIRRRGSWVAILVVGSVVAVVAAACSSSGSSAGSSAATTSTSSSAATTTAEVTGPTSSATSPDGKVTLTTVSAPAPYVSGGQVLVRVRVKGATTESPAVPPDLHLTVDGVDATSDLGRTHVIQGMGVGSVGGLVTGLHLGPNTVSAHVPGSTATLRVTDHPIEGPVFSGPRQTPFACTTEAAGLGVSTPPNCAVATTITWDYLSTDGTIKSLPPSGVPPDLAQVHVHGQQVKAIVADEKGVIDRSIYEIAVIDPQGGSDLPGVAGTTSPDQSNVEPRFAFSDLGWNGRLVYRYGGGCGTTYSQGSDFAGVLDPKLLSLGYAVTTSTLNTFQSACNAMLSAEVTLMVRQHFIETYGDPVFTIGDGGSGGSIQQLQIAQNYPGLLDGLSPELPFPDAISISGGVSDCTLLNRYYQGAGSSLTPAQRAAVNGHATDQTCDLWQASFAQEIRADSCGATVPPGQVFNAATNPTGVRCTLQDGNINQLGRDPQTGFAYRPVDNVGVQYGLKALNAGTITVDQFLDLNQQVGGYDVNGNPVAARTLGPTQAFATAFATGGVDEGGALWNVPIILTNPYDDPAGDIHDSFRKFSIRDRLTRNGTADPNLLIWTVPGPTSAGALDAQLTGALNNVSSQIVLLDQWLTAARTDPTSPSAPARLAAARPAAAVDRCTTPTGTVVSGSRTYQGSNACTQAYPVHGDPRTAAGAPQRNDVLKCQLTPAAKATYAVTFTAAQRQRLAQIFPTGVCNWSAPSVGQQSPKGVWLDYGT